MKKLEKKAAKTLTNAEAAAAAPKKIPTTAKKDVVDEVPPAAAKKGPYQKDPLEVREKPEKKNIYLM